MADPTKSSEAAAPPVTRKHFRRGRFLLALVIIVALAGLAYWVSDSFGPRMTWLTPSEFQQASKPGPLTTIKYRVSRMLGPLNRLFSRGKKALILFDSSILALSNASAAQLKLGEPAATNANGLRAWILSPQELISLTNQLSGLADATPVSKPRIMTAEGVGSSMSVGNRVLVGGSYVQAGLNINVNSKVSNGNLKLLLGVTDLEAPTNVSGTISILKTNFAVACKVVVTDAGAVVIDGGGTGDKRYWLVLSPVLVDATGKRIKH